MKYLLCTLFLSLFLISCCENSVDNHHHQAVNVTKCGHLETISLNNNYLIKSNDFNNLDKGASQCIFLKLDDDDISFGWYWSWMNMNSPGNQSYPSILWGYNYWGNNSTTTEIPVLYSDIISLVVKYDLEQKLYNTNKVNLAFDVWLSPNATPIVNTTVDERKYEIMIWENNYNKTGFKFVVANPTINNIKYKLWRALPGEDNSNKFTYFAFEPEKSQDTEEKSINLKEYIDYLINNFNVESNLYLTSIEFGNEIWYGTGKVEFKYYEINLTKR